MIGFFADTWLMRTRLDPRLGFTELLAAVRTDMLTVLDHQDISFDQIVDTLQIERDNGYSPLVQVLLILNNTPVEAFGQSELSISPVDQDRADAKLDLVLSLAQSAEGLSGTMEYNTDIYGRELILGFLDDYRLLLETVAREPQRSAAELSRLIEPRTVTRQKEREPALIEIERVLLDAPDLVACRVLRIENALIAYVTSRSRAGFDRLPEFIAERLDQKERPARYVPVSQLPRLADGAVDERALRALPILDEENERALLQDLIDRAPTAEIAVVKRFRQESAPRLHLSDLPRDGAGTRTGPAAPLAERALAETAPAASGDKISIAGGPPLPSDEDRPATLGPGAATRRDALPRSRRAPMPTNTATARSRPIRNCWIRPDASSRVCARWGSSPASP